MSCVVCWRFGCEAIATPETAKSLSPGKLKSQQAILVSSVSTDVELPREAEEVFYRLEQACYNLNENKSLRVA